MGSLGHRWTLSAETRARISAASKGKPKSAAARAAMSKAKAGKPGRPQTEEAKRKVSEARKGKPLSDEHRAKLSAAKLGRPGPWAGKVRGPQSEVWRQRIATGNKGKPASFPMRRFYYKDVPFRSSWEAAVAQQLDALGIKWEWETKRFDLGGSLTYTPDFYLPELDCYWEVKGYFGPKSRKTISLFRERYPEVRLVVATEPVLLALNPQFIAIARRCA